MTDLEGMQIFSWVVKLVIPVYAIYVLVKLFKRSGKEKAALNKILIQLVISATIGFFVFFAAAWFWLRLTQNGSGDLITCTIAGIPGFFIGMLSSFLMDGKKNGKVDKRKKAT